MITDKSSTTCHHTKILQLLTISLRCTFHSNSSFILQLEVVPHNLPSCNFHYSYCCHCHRIEHPLRIYDGCHPTVMICRSAPFLITSDSSAHPTLSLLSPANLFLPNLHLQCVWLCPLRYLKNSFVPLALYYLYWGMCQVSTTLYLFIWGNQKDSDQYCLLIRRGFISGRTRIFPPINLQIMLLFIYWILCWIISVRYICSSLCIRIILSFAFSLLLLSLLFDFTYYFVGFSWLCNTACGISQFPDQD